MGLVATGLWGCSAAPSEHGEETGRAGAPIIGGHKDRGHPAVGALVKKGDEFCTGTLVAPAVVVTAAHCVVGEKASKVKFVVAPKVSKTTAKDGIDVASLHPHPLFDPKGEDEVYDIAVVLLAESASVDPALLPIGPLADSDLVGRIATYVGYGLSDPDDDGTANTKRAVDMPIVSVTRTGIRNESSGKNTCFGDSGGPALLTTPTGDMLVGVTSWGDDDCAEFGVDTRVDAYLDFLQGYL